MDDLSNKRAAESSPKGHVLCIVSAKGGSGKTIIAASAASLLMDAGYRVLVIDTDFSTRGLSLFLLDTLTQSPHPDIRPESCIADALLGSIPPHHIAPLVVNTVKGTFSLILPNSDFKSGGAPEDTLLRLGTIEMTSSQGKNERAVAERAWQGDFENRYLSLMRGIIGRFKADYDVILLDTRGGYDYSSKIPAVLADGYVVVIEADPISVLQVDGLIKKITEFSRERGSRANHLGFIVNKALFSPEGGKGFVEALTGLYGGKGFGVIPADRNAIKAYQERSIPYKHFGGSDFSYFSSRVILQLSQSIGLNDTEPSSILEQLNRRFRRAWIVGQILAMVDRWYPTAVLILISGVLLATLGYLKGLRWSFGKIFFDVLFVFLTVALAMPFARVLATFRESKEKLWKTWLLFTAAPALCSVLLILTVPAIRTYTTGNVLLEHAKVLQTKLISEQFEVSTISQQLEQARDNLSLASLQQQQLQAQLRNANSALSATEQRAQQYQSQVSKLQVSLDNSGSPPQLTKASETETQLASFDSVYKAFPRPDPLHWQLAPSGDWLEIDNGEVVNTFTVSGKASLNQCSGSVVSKVKETTFKVFIPNGRCRNLNLYFQNDTPWRLLGDMANISYSK